ncbi:hypothetical protein SAMN05216474_0467 [Lishizhenia tianjinensis]|uniref:Uncharacterized protein n=1 Tax=Lishizhenia tianjinensis TaxID=477690 RepID=A0A1I6XWE5_9FLAO|nr:hypothetical protein [Lishizhenia tianjinensis]SFT42114.1 hypothetical protein SAMN05216474_0467 [Lishizhenia tianjinensis]
MTNSYDRQEAKRRAAEKIRLKKEREERESNAFYERITSGKQWLLFKVVVVICTLMSIVFTIETFVDGPTKTLTEEDWKINRDWEWTWHQILDVEDYIFAPLMSDWFDHVENTLEITYTPIFKTGKKLSYEIKIDENTTRHHVEWRYRSIFNWFPWLQIFLLIPLFTFIFKRKSPWFVFARIISLVFVLPGTIMVVIFAMY